MILLIGTPDASWQEPARFRARTTWPAEALRVIHPDSVSGPSDLPVEAVIGVVLDGTRPDLAEFYAGQGIPVEVVASVAPASEVAEPAGGELPPEPDDSLPATAPATTEKPPKGRPTRGE